MVPKDMKETLEVISTSDNFNVNQYSQGTCSESQKYCCSTASDVKCVECCPWPPNQDLRKAVPFTAQYSNQINHVNWFIFNYINNNFVICNFSFN
ncbi:hypothetical protein Patl1_34847 [Pistacia atlantica]|uniref:Uncharacterized protein n=1 Tax=Pistacia atlantica TaxID=434234 RepID=A0ACC0ZV36_9ROSI|nr:hypothetical protein Patl1_34847 [Pistacia atlantica]